MRSVVLFTLFAANAALAQAPGPFITTPVSPAKAVSPKVMYVKPGGIAAAAGNLQFEQRTQWVEGDESARDFLSRNGLVADGRTMSAFKTLNPQVRPDGTIPAGSKVSLFVPKPGANAGFDATGVKASIDMARIAQYSVSSEAARARQVRMQTLQLPITAYAQAGDRKSHRALVLDVDKTASLVAQRADRMSARDLALSKYYLANANQKAANVAAFARFTGVSSGSLNQLEAAVVPVQGMHMLMSTGGAPFEYRDVVVTVTAKPGSPTAPPLRVYVLPGGIVDRPETFDEDLLKQLLLDLTFQTLTTPAQSTVATGDMRVWVGADHQYEGMARLVREKKPIGFTPIRGTSANGQSLTLTFTTPDDIVKP